MTRPYWFLYTSASLVLSRARKQAGGGAGGGRGLVQVAAGRCLLELDATDAQVLEAAVNLVHSGALLFIIA